MRKYVRHKIYLRSVVKPMWKIMFKSRGFLREFSLNWRIQTYKIQIELFSRLQH